MFLNKKDASKGMTRGKFLSFLGKIGLLSLITGTTSFAQEGTDRGKFVIDKSTADADIEMPAKLRGRCNIAKLMASPGNITSHGASIAYSAADSESIRPQEGYGSGIPSPRNDSDASTRMALPNWAVVITINGASVLGSTWRNAIRISFIPTAWAASTNTISRMASVLDRTTLATRGMSGIEMARIVF